MLHSAGKIGVAIVSYRSAGVIEACLDSLAVQSDVSLKVVVVDNASDDGSPNVVRKWAGAHGEELTFSEMDLAEVGTTESWLTLVKSPVNRGFAHGTNRALELLMRDPEIGLFWVLNPDARAAPDCAAHFASSAEGEAFGLMGGRVLFEARPDTIQTDGGRVSLLTGKCTSVNWGRKLAEAAMPDAGSLNFITGAHCVASREFLERVGLMREDYFLYYEEVDWALRRGDLPLRVVPEAVVHHHGGTTIGTGSLGREPSAFSNYFNFRNRMRFLWRFSPLALPFGLMHGVAKSAQLTLKGYGDEARAALAGLFQRPPPDAVRRQISQDAQRHAFGDGE